MNDTPQSAFTRIAVELRAPAARITLQNPPLNVIDVRMMEELRAALEQIEVRPEISAIVFAGSERAFSSGVEIAEHTADKIRNTLAAFHSVIRSVVASKKLTIASVRRHCLGGGAELAIMCDVAFASEDSVWGFPEIKLACYPPVANVALSAIVGQKLAAEMILTGKTLDGATGARSGTGQRYRRRSGDAGTGMLAARLAVESGSACGCEESLLRLGCDSL